MLGMERLIDKLIIFAICMAVALQQPVDLLSIIAILGAITVASLIEIIPQRFKILLTMGYSVLGIFSFSFAIFLPLMVYDFMRHNNPVVRFLWVAPVLIGMVQHDIMVMIPLVIFCGIAVLLSIRTNDWLTREVHNVKLRDALRESSLSLEEKNQDLQAKQDYEVRIATLDERGRIAREIHDNVGHLLTRAIMQAEAMHVVHRENEKIDGDLSTLKATLHEAMDSVRTSVHNLHDDALDVEGQLRSALAGSNIEHTTLLYNVDKLDASVGYCFVAVVREAISNTLKHSDASAIEVNVQELPGLYQLIVQDNGTGSGEPGERGIGLQTMEDRVRSLGGTLRITMSNGFRIFVSIPKK